MRRKRFVLAAAGSALALSGALSTQATAADAGGVTVLATETYQNAGTNRCLDDSDLGLRAVRCHEGRTQQWTVRNLGGDLRELKNVGTGRCLDDSDRGFRTVGCNNLTTQQWRVSPSGGGIQLKSVGTGRCADDSDRGLRTVGCHGGTTQRWS
ncbi:RICIN domain-containing protein [Streptomyces yerevanensis]|uniref:RICIN domain-containing protein n=1 Tax=Streptomyces yerevanensis TaxID=66378 RepID=UPI0005252314|nr:RICIN domain-containing protein [Streptomyces yerevanensis]